MLQNALGRFNAARRAAAIERVTSILLRRACRLRDLGATPSARVHSRHYGGIRCGKISQICGSVDRTADFDLHFHPLDDRLRDRWISVAIARGQGAALPPVSLVQVGDCYFVEDGHHRISVARALGATHVDAEIIVWDVSGPLAWERPPAAQVRLGRPALRPAPPVA